MNKYKVIGIRWYENERGKGTIIHYLKEMNGDAKGYEGKTQFIVGKHIKDIEPYNEIEFVFDINYKGMPYVVDVKKINK